MELVGDLPDDDPTFIDENCGDEMIPEDELVEATVKLYQSDWDTLRRVCTHGFVMSKTTWVKAILENIFVQIGQPIRDEERR